MGAIKLKIVDGGILDNVDISRIVIYINGKDAGSRIKKRKKLI